MIRGWFFLIFCIPAILGQQIIYFKSLDVGNRTVFLSEQTSYSIYASASEDILSYLRNITLISADGDVITAYDLRSRRQNISSDVKLPWIANGPIYLKADFDGSYMTDELFGFFYIRKTSTDPITVYDVSQSNIIHLERTGTVVALNTLADQLTSLVNWRQRKDQKAAIYEGIPGTGEKQQIFENPMMLDVIGGRYQFENVERFSIYSPVFYGVFDGGIHFELSAGIVHLANFTASSATTTGLISRLRDGSASDQTISFPKSQSSSYFISGFHSLSIDPKADTKVSIDYPTYDVVTTLIYPENQVERRMMASKIHVGSDNWDKYYVQYFSIAVEDDTTVPTVSTSTTVTTVPRKAVTSTLGFKETTTTKSCEPLQNIIFIFVIFKLFV